MNHAEYKKLIKIGEEVWICDYRFNDIDNQPIRHVKPTKVIVVSNEELPGNKTVYYSEFHFRPFGKNGKPLAQVIAPYDNTGYRSNTGTSLNIFYDEKECVKHYKKQCRTIIIDFEAAKESKLKYYDKKIEQVQTEMEEF